LFTGLEKCVFLTGNDVVFVIETTVNDLRRLFYGYVFVLLIGILVFSGLNYCETMKNEKALLRMKESIVPSK
jgi:uncharacterized membrane protein YgdD (TMEM256/DUF423 family)